MTQGKSGVLLLAELKDILLRAAQARNMALDVEFSNVEATYSLEWYKTHIGSLIGYGHWLYKSLATIENEEFPEAYLLTLTEIKDVESGGVVDLIDTHRDLKKNIEAAFLAYKEVLEIHRQLEVLAAEITKHLTLADANLNQMMKRGADLDLKNLTE